MTDDQELTPEQFRHALLDPDVRKQRISLYGRGVYVNVQDLRRALEERGMRIAPGQLDELSSRLPCL